MKGRNVNRNSNKYVSLYTISQTKNASYHYLQFKTGLLLIPSVFFSFLWLNDLSYTAKVSVWCLSEEVNNSQFPTSTNATMHSVKPCPHWRLQSPNSPNSVTVAKFGDKLSPFPATIAVEIVCTGLYRHQTDRDVMMTIADHIGFSSTIAAKNVKQSM